MQTNTLFLHRTRQACVVYIGLLGFLLLFSHLAKAQEESRPEYAYIALEPDIITNYVSDNSARLGFIRVTIEIMLDQPDFIPEVEHHMPYLRAIVIEVFGSKAENTVRSLTGREEIRREILKRFKDILKRETGDEMVRDIIFTRYLRQGG